MKKKKKVPTLPNHITPVMPDPAKGIDTFNNSCDVSQANGGGTGLAEDIDTNDRFKYVSELSPDKQKKIRQQLKSAGVKGRDLQLAMNSRLVDLEDTISLKESVGSTDFETVKKEIIDATIDYMLSAGFEDEDDARAYCDFDFEDEGDRFRCEVRVELGFDGMGELSMYLNPIVERYDQDAYFDFVDSGILEAFIRKSNSVAESLKRIDRDNAHYNVFSDLTGLYESTQSKLDAKDKKKLADFVNKTDDIQEIETYINGLLSQKNESLLEYVEPTDELEDEFDKSLHDCDRNIYDELPRWCQLYLDEFDGPWVSYGRLPSGTYFYSDDYDTYFFDDVDDFIDDQRYNIIQTAEMYKDAPEEYDYSPEFVELLNSDLNKTLSEGLLLESDSYLPPDIHSYDNDPRSPFYNGPEPEDYEFESDVEVEFTQRGVIENGYWDTDEFIHDIESIKYIDEVPYDYGYLTLDDWELKQAVFDAMSTDKIQQRLPLDSDGVYQVSGTILLPFTVESITYYDVSDEWGPEYEFDDSSANITFNENNIQIEELNIERIADK